MISKPTTEQILVDCSRELTEVILPAVSDETVKVAVMMLNLVVQNAAVRSAHEIAWMRSETDDLEAFGRSVLSAYSRASGLKEALDALASAPRGSLHLDDVVETYRCASEAFSCAMEAAVAAGDDPLTSRGSSLLDRRVEHEAVVMCGWSPVGR